MAIEIETDIGTATIRTDAIAVGDIVRLKSGGPAMTVTGALDDGRISVSWFGPVESYGFGGLSSGNVLQQRAFPASVLRKDPS